MPTPDTAASKSDSPGSSTLNVLEGIKEKGASSKSNEKDDDDDDDDDGGGGDDGTLGGGGKRNSDGRFLTSYIPLVAAARAVRGYVRIRAPPGRTIPFTSVAVSLEATVLALKQVATRCLFEEVVEISGAGDVTGALDIPFVFMDAARFDLPESYEGELYSLRHTITVRVERPWYSFDCTTSVPLAVQRVHILPAIDTTTASTTASSTDTSTTAPPKMIDFNLEQEQPPSQAQPPPPEFATLLPSQIVRGDWSTLGPQQLALDSWAPNAGSIVFHFERAVYELSDTIRGQVSGLRKAAKQNIKSGY